MRIISGKFRGKRLFSLEGERTRPTSDKVKESVFNILANSGEVYGRVLDLFAGTGALGLEALSRGASDAVFVDKNPDAVKIVKSNISLCKAAGKVYNTDWQVAVRKLVGTTFDLIFLDPPYALGAEAKILHEIEDKQLLADGGVIVIEHSTDNNFDYDKSLYEADRREYRGTAVTFLRLKK